MSEVAGNVGEKLSVSAMIIGLLLVVGEMFLVDISGNLPFVTPRVSGFLRVFIWLFAVASAVVATRGKKYRTIAWLLLCGYAVGLLALLLPRLSVG